VPKINVPTDPDGLQEFLSNPAKLKDVFSPEAVADGSSKAFLDVYAKEFVKRNPDSVDDLKTQVQSVMFDLMRENGAGVPGMKLGNAVNFRDGKPTLSPDGSAAMSQGRGTVYNKYSPGAQMEQAIPEADRFHSIGEMCMAIKYKMTAQQGRRREELITKLDKVTAFQNSFSSEDPGAGGFLIPEVMRSELFMLALENSLVRSNATVIPMSTLSTRLPAVDDTSHTSSVMGGVTFAWTEEAATITESQATFDSIQLVAKKLAGYFSVPNELLNDAPAFSGFFDAQIPKGLAWFEDNAFMNEDGVGAPLGFINCPAMVTVSGQSGQAASTIIWENVVQMYSQMLPTSVNNAIWIVSPDTFPQLATMALSVGTGGGPVWIGGWGNSSGANTPPMTILGRPVYVTEKVGPLGTAGDINFVDLAYYVIGDRQSVEVAASDQFLFSSDKTAFRLIERVDGRPWIQSALTPHNNSSALLSPFVNLSSSR
jgi:HK97 family phage major capsid protein